MKDPIALDGLQLSLMHEDWHMQLCLARRQWQYILISVKRKQLEVLSSSVSGFGKEKPPSNDVIIFLILSTGSSVLSMEILRSGFLYWDGTAFELRRIRLYILG